MIPSLSLRGSASPAVPVEIYILILALIALLVVSLLK
jgi:hypothetical protein